MSVRIGSYVGGDPLGPAARIETEAPSLRRHADRPWFRAYLASRFGVDLPGTRPRAEQVHAEAPPTALARHAFVCGSTGSGKSRLLLHLLREQAASGCSVLLLDPKGETYDSFLALAEAAGAPPRRVVLLDPRGTEAGTPEGVPGWNPFAAAPPVQAAADFVAAVRRSSPSWGARLQDLLTNACILVATLGLSVFELARLLISEDYREALLHQPAAPADPAGYREVLAYFRNEFAAWGRSERAAAVAPVLNKVRGYVRSAFLRALLCARRDTLRLAELWARPALVLVRLDRATLGEEGSGLLAGLLAQLLFRTAMRAAGPVPVVLAVDELPVVEGYVGATMGEILSLARSMGLRCVAACQHLDQLSPELRSSLLANTAVQTLFRLGPADARLAAATLAAGEPSRLVRASVLPERGTVGVPERACWSHALFDPRGRRLRMAPAAWERFRWEALASSDPLAALRAATARSRVGRLYVRAADTGEAVAAHRYVAGLDPGEYWLEGPELALVVSFPRPRLADSERRGEEHARQAWTRVLQDLPVQHAVVRLPGQPPRVAKVADVALPGADPRRHRAFLTASQAATAQPAAEVDATIEWREAQVERLGPGGAADEPAAPSAQKGSSAAGRRTRPVAAAGREEADDGSLY